MVGYMDRKREREYKKKKKILKFEVFEIVWLGFVFMRCVGFGKICSVNGIGKEWN